MNANLQNPIFTDEDKAREYLEAVRWPEGPYCPHCGAVEGLKKLEGKSHRPGLYQCNSCRGHFTVTVGTVYERSKVPLTKWLLATYLLTSSKKGISAHQIHRTLGVTYKTAWFMCHRIRESMRDANPTPMGGNGETIEIDETYIGRKPHMKKVTGGNHKHAVLTLVTRGGKARSFHVDGVASKDLLPRIRHNVMQDTKIMTDEHAAYRKLGGEFAEHHVVNHSADEYVRGVAYTNTVEGFFSIFKRGMKGVYQHCGEQHLQRYLTEFDFRYSNRKLSDIDRATTAVAGIVGKRLTYRRSNKPA
jgi:transposase-like protein